ncbi:hypothetical protein CANCADRAFT_32610 [Tortispora caseinolytica NRRL Y-17796]|uniref:tRNA (adenine(58)-N(1))-methyltransferase catalytic subunit TRM61 n=1 Tax=Tortispora caseinolytica NRRL Y-17796 TaxID=767744 RepID=A0A1E4TC21_9ASCO|nr:hypothetical protein CANCADRAFT_32610 [Tortispora caseinolytica NRRL Y-17796]
MGFLDLPNVISEGDLVMVRLGKSQFKPVTMQSGETLHTRYGSYPHNDMIGKPYGSQIPAMGDKGFVHVLAPTPELWTLSLPHRTQIVYTPDASYIVQRLEIRPGSKVIEAGTGSGSFTHALGRTVGTSGDVWTFEFHEVRWEAAKVELEQHGYKDIVHSFYRDVCSDGFQPASGVHAVFLDLPKPWLAIPSLPQYLELGGISRICCFSPCVEQVIETIKTLKECSWTQIETVEVSCREWIVRKEMRRTLEDVLKRQESFRERRSAIQQRKRKLEELEKQDDDDDSSVVGSPPNKDDIPYVDLYNPWGKGERIVKGDDRFQWDIFSAGERDIKSHTSFLTFAVLAPAPPKMKT